MAFRNVYIQNDVKLKIKNEQLVVMKDTNEYTKNICNNIYVKKVYRA